VQVVVTDLMMPGTSGLELLKALKTISPDTEVVLMTAYGTVETAVSAMKEGAFDFVEKPLKRASIVKSVRLAAAHQKLIAENKALKKKLEILTSREIVGTSPALRKVLEIVTQAAPSMATVLVLGESGTGKELLARYLHERSTRAGGPFVPVNCAAIPESILEAELFGHEKGSFTGAVARREPCSSTRSASCRRRCRSSCCASCKRASTNRSAETRARPTYASSPRRTAT
jgi:two-component system response regulator HydG